MCQKIDSNYVIEYQIEPQGLIIARACKIEKGNRRKNYSWNQMHMATVRRTDDSTLKSHLHIQNLCSVTRSSLLSGKSRHYMYEHGCIFVILGARKSQPELSYSSSADGSISTLLYLDTSLSKCKHSHRVIRVFPYEGKSW